MPTQATFHNYRTRNSFTQAGRSTVELDLARQPTTYQDPASLAPPPFTRYGSPQPAGGNTRQAAGHASDSSARWAPPAYDSVNQRLSAASYDGGQQRANVSAYDGDAPAAGYRRPQEGGLNLPSSSNGYQTGYSGASVRVCVCVCVRERERGGGREKVCVCVVVAACACGSIQASGGGGLM